MRVTSKSVNCECSKFPLIVWVGLIQSCEGLNRKKTDLLRTEGNSAWSLPLYSTATFPWVSSLPDYPEDFELTRLHNYVSQFLKSSASLSPHICVCACACEYVHAHILLFLFPWSTLTNPVPTLLHYGHQFHLLCLFFLDYFKLLLPFTYFLTRLSFDFTVFCQVSWLLLPTYMDYLGFLSLNVHIYLHLGCQTLIFSSLTLFVLSSLRNALTIHSKIEMENLLDTYNSSLISMSKQV